MLSYIELKNFKSLTDFKIDFRGKGGVPKKVLFLYGENGSGKTNLVSSLFFLKQSLRTLSYHLSLHDLSNNVTPDVLSRINEQGAREQLLDDLLGKTTPSLSTLLEESKTIGSRDNMYLKIGFHIDGVEGAYELEFDDRSVVFEELRYLVNERVGVLFSIREGAIKFSPSFVLDSKYKKYLVDEIKKYWGKHTFMSIIYNEVNAKNDSFIDSSLSAAFLKVFDFFYTMSSACKNRWGDSLAIATPAVIPLNLLEGTISKKRDTGLLAMESFLNSVFTQLYSDIKAIFYKFKFNGDLLSYELYVKKMIGSNIIEVPFGMESTGTQKLLNLVEYILLSLLGTTVVVDEIDSGIHDLLIYQVIELFLDAIYTEEISQFIVTTHNTSLLEMVGDILPKESVYLLTIDSRGEKEALSLDKYKLRTQKNHNIRSKYLKGDYDAVPNIGYVDFNELVDDFRDAMGNHL